jgi:hypothetical protein
MSSTKHKTWMQDLSASVIAMAKEKAVEANAAWHASVDSILTVAKAVYEVQEKIGGAPKGNFGLWVVEELGRSPETGSVLATVGARYDILWKSKESLPPSLYTLYELARQEDPVFLAAMPHVNADLTRRQMQLVLGHAWTAVNSPDFDPWDKKFDPSVNDALSWLMQKADRFLEPGRDEDQRLQLIVEDRTHLQPYQIEKLCEIFVGLIHRSMAGLESLRQRRRITPTIEPVMSDEQLRGLFAHDGPTLLDFMHDNDEKLEATASQKNVD